MSYLQVNSTYFKEEKECQRTRENYVFCDIICNKNNVPEQQNIEYKQSWHDDYLKWVCGFANAQGG